MPFTRPRPLESGSVSEQPTLPDTDPVPQVDAPPPAPEDVMGVLQSVIDPELGSDIVSLGMARKATVEPTGKVRISILLTTSGCPLRAEIQREVRAKVAALPGVAEVKIDWGELDAQQKAETMARAREAMAQRPETTAVPLTTKILLVSSGKGGVGKSSVTVNLAAALAARGYGVGVLDADIWGFSVPRMLGIEDRLAADDEGRINPIRVPIGSGHIDAVSMGMLVEEEGSALMWRGLILNRAVRHFLEDVAWEGIDYLLVDMPPGTGDVQMGLAKMLPRAEMLVVTTPSLNAQKVAVRVVDMGRKNQLHIAGVVENMSAYVDDTGREHRIFGEGGATQLAADAGIPMLGSIPIEPEVATGGDRGTPAALGDGAAAAAFSELTDTVLRICPPTEMAGCTARLLGAVETALDEADSAAEVIGSPAQ